MNDLSDLIRLGGVVHWLIVLVSLAVPLAMNWWKLLATVEGFMRQLLWVYGGFILFVNAGMGTLSLTQSAMLASGTALGRSLCAFIAIYWLARLIIQLFVFDVRPLGLNRLVRFGYHSLTAAFVFLTIVYGLAAVTPSIGGR